VNRAIHAYLADIGRRGGRKSRRALDPETARAMVRVREARRAYRRFHAECFGSFEPAYRVGPSDVAWVAAQLRRHGGREARDVAQKLTPMTDAPAVLEHQRALERFSAWEAQHPRAPTPEAAVGGIGYLYDLLPVEARRRPVDTRGVQALHRALSVLTAGQE